MARRKSKRKGGGGGEATPIGALTPAPRAPLDPLADAKRKRERARTTIKARVAREQWREELKNYDEFWVPLADIRRASDSYDANLIAAAAIRHIENEKGYVRCGFDTEGSIKVLQLHFNFEHSSYSHVYQLNKFVRDGDAPEKLKELLTHPRIVFTGKKVNEEVIDVMKMCGVDEANIRTTRIVETQRCFESIEMISRGKSYAHRYFEFGIYAPNY